MVSEQIIAQNPVGIDWLFNNHPAASVFIPEELSPDLIEIKKEVRNFYITEVEPLIPELEKMDRSLLKSLLKKMGSKGYLSPSIPKQYNGKGLSKLASFFINFSGGDYISFAVTIAAHNGIGTFPVLHFGNEKQKKKFLPGLASGKLIAAYGLTEPNSGSDALSAKTTATLSEDGKYYILNGQKCWITNGGIADLFTIFAKVDGKHFTAFLIENETEGFTKGEEEHKMGLKGSSTVQLYFQDCKIPAENLLGEIGKGHVIALTTLNSGRLNLGFMALGICESIFAKMLSYIKNNPSNSLKRKSQIIQSKIAKLSSIYWALESTLFRTIEIHKDDEFSINQNENSLFQNNEVEFVIEAAILKVFSSEMLNYFGDELVQVMELNGYDEDLFAARFYRDVRVTKIFEGTNEINRILLIEMLLKITSNGQILKQFADTLQIDIQNRIEQFTEDSFETEKILIKHLKIAFILLITEVIKRFDGKLKEEQEIVLQLSDLLIYTFLAESAILRAIKLNSFVGNDFASIYILKMRCILSQFADDFYCTGKNLLHCLDISGNSKIQLFLEKSCNYLEFNRKEAERIIATSLLHDLEIEI